MISKWEFTVWFDGYDWIARGQGNGRSVQAQGTTPVTALMFAEARARMAVRDA